MASISQSKPDPDDFEEESEFRIVLTSGTHLGLREDQKELEFDAVDCLEEVL